MLGSGARTRDIASRAQDRRQSQVGVAVIDQRVGAAGQRHRLPGHPPRFVMNAVAGQKLGSNDTPRDRRLQCVPGEVLALRAQLVGFAVAALSQTRSCKQCRRLGGIGFQAHASKAVVGPAEMRFGSGGFIGDQFQDARELIDLEQRVPHAELGERAPRGVEQRATRRSATPKRVEDALAPRRRRLHHR